MTFKEVKYLIRSDLYRHEGCSNTSGFLKHFFLTPGFRYSCVMRCCDYLSKNQFTKVSIYFIFKILLRRYMVKYGISIPHQTSIGSGFYIGHFGGIVVNYKTKIGNNCNISQNVTIGRANRGKKTGCPTLGDNIYIGPGAAIIGKINIGNNVAIGANCVVTHDIPDNAVVVGVPGKVISMAGSEGYVNRTDY